MPSCDPRGAGCGRRRSVGSRARRSPAGPVFERRARRRASSLTTRETVLKLTLARAATSRIVGLRRRPAGTRACRSRSSLDPSRATSPRTRRDAWDQVAPTLSRNRCALPTRDRDRGFTLVMRNCKRSQSLTTLSQRCQMSTMTKGRSDEPGSEPAGGGPPRWPPGGGRSRAHRLRWRRQRRRAGGGSGGGGGEQPIVGLITKTDTNPFFVKMKEGAQAAADRAGRGAADLRRQAGRRQRVAGPGDREPDLGRAPRASSSPRATPRPSCPRSTRPSRPGLLVIALDTPTEPADAADATFATDNFQAGLLIGQWAKTKFDAEGKQAKIAMLDLNANGVSVDVQRDQGFLQGFGIDVGRQGPDRRRVRPADRRPRRDRRRRGGRPDRDGEPAAEGPVDQPRLHDQRAGRGRRVRGAQGGRQGEGRHDRLGRRRLPRGRGRQGAARSAPPRSSTR